MKTLTITLNVDKTATIIRDGERTVVSDFYLADLLRFKRLYKENGYEEKRYDFAYGGVIVLEMSKYEIGGWIDESIPKRISWLQRIMARLRRLF